MTSKRSVVAALAVLSLSFSAPVAKADILNFDPNIACGSTVCINGSQISQDYGDTAQVNVTYASTLNWSGSGYSPWFGVAHGASGTWISIAPLNGQAVTLNRFDMAAVDGETSHSTNVAIYDLVLGTLLFDFGTATVMQPTSFAGNIASSANGIRITWNSDGNSNVAIDNIDYTLTDVRAVPLGHSPWVTLIFGVLGVGFMAYRRSRVSIAA